MNNHLNQVLCDHGISNVIQHHQMSLVDALNKYSGKLLVNSIEGIVINFGNEIFKWKGLDESYPDSFMSEIIDNIDSKRLSKPCHPIKLVANEARKHWAQMKQEKSTLFHLEKAYKSALSKIKSLEDHKSESGTVEEDKVHNFQRALEQEMIKDSHCDMHFQEKLSAFIQTKLKSI